MRAALLSLLLAFVLAAASGCQSYSSRSYARADAYSVYGYSGAAPPGFGAESPDRVRRSTTTTVVVQDSIPVGRPYYWHDAYWAYAHPATCGCGPTYSTQAYVFGGYARRSYRDRAFRSGYSYARGSAGIARGSSGGRRGR